MTAVISRQRKRELLGSKNTKLHGYFLQPCKAFNSHKTRNCSLRRRCDPIDGQYGRLRLLTRSCKTSSSQSARCGAPPSQAPIPAKCFMVVGSAATCRLPSGCNISLMQETRSCIHMPYKSAECRYTARGVADYAESRPDDDDPH